MANLVTKSKSRTALIIVALLFIVSIFSIYFFRLNLGVEFNDAKVIVVQLDHEDNITDIQNKVSNYVNLSKIEKESTNKFYLYLQNYSPEQITSITDNIKANINGVLTTDNFDYYTAREHSLLIRIEILSGFALLVYSVYFVLNLKNKKILRKDVLALFFTDLILITVCTVILGGFISLIGRFGVIMNVNFVSLALFSFGLIMLFRIFDLQKFKALFKTEEYKDLVTTNKLQINYYWPEYVFLAAFLILVLFIPLTVFDISILKAASMIIVSILISLVTCLYIKAICSEFISSLFELEALKKITFFKKQW